MHAVATRPDAAEVGPSRGSEPRRRRLLTWLDGGPFAASAAFSAVFIARSAFRIRGRLAFSLFDDAMVSMTYARNLAHGHGLVWYPGARPVEGYTNPLWTMWMAVLHLTGLPDRLVSLAVMMTGAVLLLLTLVAVRRLARELAGDDRLVVAVASWLTVACYSLAYWTLRGMEVGLLTCLATAAAVLAAETRRTGRPRVAALVLVITAGLLTREDFVVVAVIIGIATVAWSLSRRRVAIALATTVVATLGAEELFRLVYYHELVPNTYVLKIAGTPLLARLDRGLLVLVQTLGIELVVPLGVIALGILQQRRRRDPRLVLLTALVGGQFAYTLWTGGDAWEWMLTPDRFVTIALPFLVVLTAIAIRRIRDAPDPARVRALALRTAAVAALVALFALSCTVGRSDLRLVTGPGVATDSVRAALVGLVLVVLLGATRNRLGSRSGVVAVVVTLAVVAAANGVALRDWVSHNAVHVGDDQREARLGDELRRVTDGRARIAVTWAGAVPYFSHRPSVDLLGKMDPVIARSRPHPRGFYPGHTKWDYAYSIRTLRPDVVTYVLRGGDAATLAGIEAWGYLELATRSFVRSGTSHVDVEALRRYEQRFPPVG